MAMRPILFSTEMVRAILDGRKTVTRRLVTPQPVKDGRLWRFGGAVWPDCLDRVIPVPCHGLWKAVKIHPGDILYVRETWNAMAELPEISEAGYVYKADMSDVELEQMASKNFRWRPSIHMPKEAARLFIRVTSVRMERLQRITEQEAMAEGIYRVQTWPDIGRFTYETNPAMGHVWSTARGCFQWGLWNSTVKPEDIHRFGWDADPWVLAIEFERTSREGDG